MYFLNFLFCFDCTGHKKWKFETNGYKEKKEKRKKKKKREKVENQQSIKKPVTYKKKRKSKLI